MAGTRGGEGMGKGNLGTKSTKNGNNYARHIDGFPTILLSARKEKRAYMRYKAIWRCRGSAGGGGR